ncbi:MAG TPA: hypothetical protein VGP94_13495, partial [Tepidisphaeraceae bacterium]|nr:hypothetical protein [Tepidisphaeraceae bacterium]
MTEFITPLEPRLFMAGNMTESFANSDLLIAGGRAGSGFFDRATPARPIQRQFDFNRGARGWGAGFADYPAGSESSFELDSGIRKLPGRLASTAKKGFFITGNNHSDDLFMFLKKRLGPADGIKAGQTYRVSFDIAFASAAPEDCAGIGGSPGNSVFLKAGADQREPKAVVVDGTRTMNVDKGNQGEGGKAASVAGDISNGIPCDEALQNPAGPPWRI